MATKTVHGPLLPRPIGQLRNIVVTGVRATLSTRPVLVPASATRTSRVTNFTGGLPGHPIPNITLAAAVKTTL
ncbi:MAG: hypothetical protein Q8N18_11935 [Opitutaceae bacterium]|nr:hypothetical protein [Opitutaceae bacterium]